MRYKITIEYDGTPFIGWQKQEGQLSVQGVLEAALKTYLRQETPLCGSGRTDAGVHAVGQVAHFDCEQKLNPKAFLYSLNSLMRPHPVVIKKIEKVSEVFHARFSAVQRTYLYRIQNTPYFPALNKGKVWHIGPKLNVKKMNEAAQILLGKHDFSTFRAANCQAKSPIKTLDFIQVKRKGEEVQMLIQARSFLYHQVRNIIGTLVLVGLGKWTISDFEKAFRAKDRKKGGQTAPAEGLFFIKVNY